MTSVVWCCKLVILTLGKRRQKHCDLEVNVRLCPKKNAVGVAQLAVCLAYMKPLVGSLALHKFAVTSTPKIPGLGKNQNSATPFESEANFGFQTSSQNKGGLK